MFLSRIVEPIYVIFEVQEGRDVMGASRQQEVENSHSSSPAKQSRRQRRKSETIKAENGPITAHDWSKEKATKLDAKINPVEVLFFDDGTATFFFVRETLLMVT